MKILKISLAILVLALIVIQFINRPEKISEPVTQDDIIQDLNIRPEVASLLKSACYDCHSNQPRYPWYAHVAPVSWSIAEHIRTWPKRAELLRMGYLFS